MSRRLDLAIRRGRRKKKPDEMTRLKVEWLMWLVDQYGPHEVGEWHFPPISFSRWLAARRRAV